MTPCERKRIWFTMEKAREVADQARRERKVRLRIYRCPDCGGFHLTKEERANRPRRSERPMP